MKIIHFKFSKRKQKKYFEEGEKQHEQWDC